ncbi:DUF4342 domain-containing protein [Bacilliculturomica massiliensis]|uniref:DUF4342 domain-containing protein n=1 Tax=Bacilliculturomica massiliensis TaxID=1917867 RepID=UPI00102FAAB1|nr:DUF4342 domain-containing protein [Bacilliculturomica massiliensis]
MEITLEKIELVKDRTGVSYKEAKEALEKAEGSVVDAIISIEETIDINSKSRMGEQGAQIIDKLKEAIRKGNVSKITIKKDGEILLNLPVNIGIIGTVLFPWAAVAATIAAFGTKCSIELLKDNGEIVDVSEMACDTFENVKEKSSAIADEVKVKGADVINTVKEKASDAMSRSRDEDGEDEDEDECGCCCGDEFDCDDSCCLEEEKEDPNKDDSL